MCIRPSTAAPLLLEATFKFRSSLQLSACDGLVNRTTVNNYCLLTLLKVSCMTAEKTVRRWAAFVHCRWFKGHTAHATVDVIRNKVVRMYIFFPIKKNKIKYWRNGIYVLANNETAFLFVCFMSASLHKDIRDCPLRGRKKLHAAMKRSFAQQNNGWMKRRAFKMSDRRHCFDIYSNTKVSRFHAISVEQLQVPFSAPWYQFPTFVCRFSYTL